MRGTFRLERIVTTTDGSRAEGVFAGELIAGDGTFIGTASRRQSAPARIHGPMGNPATIGPVEVDVMGFTIHLEAVKVPTPWALDEEPAVEGPPTADIFDARRPWGDFTQLVSNTHVTVKIITIKPGHRLSLQRHSHRGEMWQILDVPIDVTIGAQKRTAMPGSTVWVPRGSVHRMGNSGRTSGRVLEVAFGHFDEEDIQRLEDDYAR